MSLNANKPTIRPFLVATTLLLSIALPARAGRNDKPDNNESSTIDGQAGKSADKNAWTDSLVPSALPKTLARRKLLVAAAGENLEEARKAAKTLRLALYDAGSPLVMDGSSIGEIADKNDEKIVEAASSFPVHGVVVVRVFPGGNAPDAVFSCYSLEGETIAGFSVEKGKQLKSDAAKPAAQGISHDTVDSIDETMSPELDHETGQDGNLRFEVDTQKRWTLKDRKTGETYRGVNIYRRLDRPRLVDQYRENSRLKSAWIVAGVAGTILGTVGTITGLRLYKHAEERVCPPNGSVGECQPRYQHNGNESAPTTTSLLAAGAGTLAAGGISAAIGAALQTPHPIYKSQLEKLVRQENEPYDPASSPTPRFGWSVGPTDGRVAATLSIRW